MNYKQTLSKKWREENSIELILWGKHYTDIKTKEITRKEKYTSIFFITIDTRIQKPKC